MEVSPFILFFCVFANIIEGKYKKKKKESNMTGVTWQARTESEKSRYQVLPFSKKKSVGVLTWLGQPDAPTQISENGAITANRNSV